MAVNDPMERNALSSEELTIDDLDRRLSALETPAVLTCASFNSCSSLKNCGNFTGCRTLTHCGRYVCGPCPKFRL